MKKIGSVSLLPRSIWIYLILITFQIVYVGEVLDNIDPNDIYVAFHLGLFETPDTASSCSESSEDGGHNSDEDPTSGDEVDMDVSFVLDDSKN